MSFGKYAAGLAAAASVLALSTAAGAATTIWTYSGALADGTGNASATLTEGVSSLTINLTNLLTNPISDGREISGISFTLSDMPTGVSLFSSSGTLINIAKKTGAVTASADTIDHWGAGIGGTSIFLEAAGPFALGAQPHDLIIGLGPYTNANASISGKNPHIQGTGIFVLNFTGLTDPVHVTGVSIAFGTTGEDFHTATCTPGSCPTTVTTGVPEPASWALMIMGFGGIGAMVRRRRTVFA